MTHLQVSLCAGHQALHEPLKAAQKLLQALQTCSTPHSLCAIPPAGLHSGVPCQGLGQHHRMAQLQAVLEVSTQSAAASQREVCRGEAWEEKGGSTWEEEGAQVGASRAHEACEHAEGRLLRQVHQDDARHKRHALTVRHLPTPLPRLRCIADSACLPPDP